MITIDLTFEHPIYKWAKNACETYDLDLETLIFLSVEYCGKKMIKGMSDEPYARHNTYLSPVFYSVMLTETCYNMIERLIKGTICTERYLIYMCLQHVMLNFEDFERWYDNQHLAHAEGIPGVPVTLKQRKEEKNNV